MKICTREVIFIRRYLQFLRDCLPSPSHFFARSSLEKAALLAKHRLSFLAGIYYMDGGDYLEAAESFKAAHAHKHLVIAYEKQGYYQKALQLADTYNLHKLGVRISLHINDLKSAAYFYTYSDLDHAAKLYRDLHYYYEAGYTFLANHDPLYAIDMFRRCSQAKQRETGFKQVSEYALVLFFNKSYETAFKIFMALDDYYSALECARRLKEEKLIASCHLLIALDEASKGNFLFAAQSIEHYEPIQASYYYALAGDYESQIRLLLSKEEYEKAMQVCLLHNNLNTAYEIASTYNLDLFTSTSA